MLGAFEERDRRLRVELDEHGSVVEAVEKPVAREPIANEPAERAVAEHHIPFVSRPRLGVPPLARRAPRARARDDTSRVHVRRSLTRGPHVHTARRPDPTQREPMLTLARRISSVGESTRLITGSGRVLSQGAPPPSTIGRLGLGRRRERAHRPGS